MNLSTYNLNDLNTYLSGTFIQLDGKPSYITDVIGLDSDGDQIDYDYTPDAVQLHITQRSRSVIKETVIEFPYNSTLPTIPVPLGYYNYKNFVVYLYHIQGNHYKKLPTLGSIHLFNPQSREFEHLRIRDYELDRSTIRDLLLASPNYTPLDEAYQLLKSKEKHAVALHKSYAIVKKGKYADPVIYYKTDPVITYDGTTLTPLVDPCHVNKFRIEVL